MSIGGNSNLGTMLIRRLDTASGIQASQQSQLVNSARSNAIAQLADAARIDPVQNQTERALPETIDRARAQVERQARRTVEGGKLETPPHLRVARPIVDASFTPSAPTSLGSAARTILALLSLFPDAPPPLQGRSPLLAASPTEANTPATGGDRRTMGLPSGTGAGAQGPSGANTPAAGTPAAGTPAAASSATGAPHADRPSTTPANASGQSIAASAPASTQGLPAQFIRALSQALQQSGAFYESHLHDFAQGKRTSEELRQEPQGRVATAGQSPGANATASASSAHTQPGQSAAGTTHNHHVSLTASTAPGHTNGLHPDTQPVVRQQLEILATQTLAWRGEVWPETAMEWEISRRNEDGLSDEAGSHWSTRLRLTFPGLGEVEARISLHEKQVVMRVVAPRSASMLAQHDQALRAGFSDAGLILSQLSILKEAGHDH